MTLIVNLTIRKEPMYRRAAFESGLKRLGYTIGNFTAPTGKDSLLVLWNKKRGSEERQADEWERRGGTVLVVENGYLQPVDKTYYAISTHGHNGSGWFPVGDEDRFTKLGFTIKPTVLRDGPIVVRAQRGIGSALMASPPQWAEKMVEKLKRAGHKDVRLAKHPGDKNKFAADLAALKGASELLIWSSAMGVRALVEGIPVTHHAPHWVCEGWLGGRREWALQRAAHNQWHFDEIAQGLPFARMRDKNWGPSWV